jgi:hypothetical protein
MEWAMDQDQYEAWQEGRASITECVTDTVRLLREQTVAAPSMSRLDRYSFVIGCLTASVDPELRHDLVELIRGGAV